MLFCFKGVEGFSAQTVQKICRISHRQLGYWIDRGVISPKFVYGSARERGGKKLHVFSRQDLERTLLVAKLRRLGFSLIRIRETIEVIANQTAKGQKIENLLFDGENLVDADSDGTLTEIMSKQTCFLVVGLRSISGEVGQYLENHKPVRPSDFSNFDRERLALTEEYSKAI